MRTRTLPSLAVLAFTVCSLAPVGHAEQAPAASANAPKIQSHDKAQTHEVVLPVTVRDKHGAMVTSIDKSDFTLTDEGRPQTIASLTRETTPHMRVGLLVDTGKSVSGAMESERKAAGKFVDLMLPAQGSEGKDQAFLIHFDREVELLEDFTGSRDKLHRELDQMGPTHQSQNQSQGPETTGESRGEAHGGRGGAQLYDAIFLASDELMKTKDGRKALVVFSDGVDRGSKETLNEAVDAADRAKLAVYTIFYK